MILCYLVLANFVPAAVIIQEEQALLKLIDRLIF